MGHLPTQRDLDELWKQTAHVHVFDTASRPATPAEAERSAKFMMDEFGMRDSGGGEIVVRRFVLDIADPDELEQFQQRCSVLDGDGGMALCSPHYYFVVFNRNGESIATLGYNPPEMLRWDSWTGDTDLVDPFGLANWLEQHGIAPPERPPASAQADAETDRADPQPRRTT